MEKKDTLSSCSESEEQQMQLIQDKSKESCMVSFQRLHSHLKRLSNNDLKGSRTENGFGRAFATLFGQDFEIFTGTMFLNMDQLQKQLDNNEFQEIGSMASFKVLETQFQMFIKSKIYLNDEYIVMTRNYFLQYTQLDIPEFRETLVQFMEYVKKSIDERALHKREHDSRDTSSRSGNDAHVDDADIRPIYDEEPKAEVQMTADDNVSATGQQHTEQPESNNEGEVDQNADLIWVPTGKIFTSSTTKVDSEPPNGSNADITNQCEIEQALDVSAENRASRNFDLMIIKWRLLKITLQAPFLNVQMTFEHNSSSLGHQCLMMSDHNSSDLAPQRQMASAENNTSGPVPQCSNDVCSHQFRPLKFKAGSKSCSLSKQDSYITTRVGITIPPSYSNAEDNSHKVVRLGFNPMIQPELEDLPQQGVSNNVLKPGQYICCQNYKMIAGIENDIMDPVMQCTTLPSHSSFPQQKLVSFITEIHTLSIDISFRDR
ncbi:hypothetical protein Tco_1203160 [Tanacetum coccineum]